jgi:hypothetical protein
MISLKKFWNNYGWHCIAILSILFILIGVIFRSKETEDDGEIYKSFILRKYPRSFHPKEQKNLEHKKPNDPGYVSKGEIKCRYILEKLFNKPFYKIRPDFLKNDVTGKNIEIDMYNPELKLCLEMNGRQHYEYVPYFHPNKEAFLNQRYRDEMKKTKCRENGLNIIEVPYNVKLEDMEEFIRKKCKELGYSV